MHIMQELPTNKPNFLFNNTGFQPDYTLRTARIDNISLYFSCIAFVQDVFKRSHNGMSQGRGCQNAAVFTCLLFHNFDSNMASVATFAIRNCKYPLSISNFHILNELIAKLKYTV